MWSFEHSAESTGRPADVWALYEDVERWNVWSPGVVWSRLDGALRVGAKGKTKIKGLPASGFTVERVERDRVFETVTRLPGARLVFEHRIDPQHDGIVITHRGQLTGPLAWVVARVIGASVRLNLPAGVQKLAALAAR